MNDSGQQQCEQINECQCFPMSELDGIAICQWKYNEPYDVFNWPEWSKLEADQREFADPDIRNQQYFAVKNSKGELLAYFQLFPLQHTIRLGIFVHPLLVNRGIGKQVCRLAIQTASYKFTKPYIDLEVSTWNSRAIHVYEQLGFKFEDEYKLFNRITNKAEPVYNMVWSQETKTKLGKMGEY